MAEAADGGAFWSVFTLEHDRLWAVAQRGYTIVPDGLTLERGVMARTVRTGRTQAALDVAADPDYVAAQRGVVSELCVPLKSGRTVVGVLNVETTFPLPADTAKVLQPLVRRLSEQVASLHDTPAIGLSALARLFVHMSSLRDPGAIAELAAQSLARVLELEACRIVLADDDGGFELAAAWHRDGAEPLPDGLLAAIRPNVEPTAVLDFVDVADAGLGELVGGCRTLVWLPLRANGRLVGSLIGTVRAARPATRDQAEAAALLAAQAAAAIDAAQAIGRERRTAATDPLTGLLNRRGFDDRIEEKLERATGERSPLTLCVLDCDDFKAVNDLGGHERGDRVLVEMARLIGTLLGAGDTSARLGGDEFALLFARTDAEAGQRRADELRRALARGLTEAGTPLTVSIGVATYPFDGANGTELMRAADQALYGAKAGGKDLVVAFRDLADWSRRGAVRPRGDRRGGGAQRAVTLDPEAFVDAIRDAAAPDDVLVGLCRALTGALAASAALVSVVDGERLIDSQSYALRDIDIGGAVSYLLEDFPLTRDVLTTRRPRAMSFLDDRIDRAEAFILRELKMNSLLMLPVVRDGQAWGLAEVYDVRLRPFEAEEIAVATWLVTEAVARLEALAAAGLQPTLVDGASRPLHRPVRGSLAKRSAQLRTAPS